jgi:hypothetical protein
MLLALLIGSGGAAGAPVTGADEKTTVEMYFGAEYLPEGLKPGAKVDLQVVKGKTATPTGIVSYSTFVLVTNIEVVSLTPMEKPPVPEQAFKVELRETKPRRSPRPKSNASRPWSENRMAAGKPRKNL